MSQDNHPDLRGNPRSPIELKVEYRKVNSFFADYTKNISKGGTFIKTKKPLPIGTRFLFKLSVPGRPEPFELLGEIAWARSDGDEPGMGIRFVYSSDAQRLEFENVVERLMFESLGPLLSERLLTRKGPPPRRADSNALAGAAPTRASVLLSLLVAPVGVLPARCGSAWRGGTDWHRAATERAKRRSWAGRARPVSRSLPLPLS